MYEDLPSIARSPLMMAYASNLAQQQAPKKKPALYSRLFDAFSPQPDDPNLGEKQKVALFRQGLMNFAAGMLQPSGGDFGASLSNGLVAGLGSMNQGADNYLTNRYKWEKMRNGGEDPSGYRQFALTAKAAGLEPGSPEYQRAAQIALGMEGRASNAGIGFDSIVGPDGKKRPTRMNPRTGAYEVWDENANDFVPITGQQMASAAPVKSPLALQDYGPAETDNYVRSIMSKAGNIDPNAPPEQIAAQLMPFLVNQESGGNPNAVSPKGAFGLTQLMPGTARDPGFGIRPMQSNTPDEQMRVGREYLVAMLKRYPGRPDLALAAYNSGPGSVDRLVAGPPSRNLVVGRSPEEQAGLTADAEQRAKLQYAPAFANVDVQAAGDKVRSEAAAQQDVAVGKRAFAANDSLGLLDQAEPLIPLSTGSGAGALWDSGAGFFGISNQGAQAGAQLKTIAGQLVAKMPRMEGPQSDRDVQLYKDMAGNLADTTKPREERMAALKTLRELQRKYANQAPASAPRQQPQRAPSKPGGWSIQKVP